MNNVILLLVLLVPLTHAHAGAANFTNPLNSPTLQDFLLAILNSLVFILFPVIVIMIVYTGFLFVAAQGEPTKLSAAKRAFIWTVIGALVVLGAKALALGVQATVNSI